MMEWTIRIICQMGYKIEPIFYQVMYMSVLAILVGCILLLIEEVLDKKITPKWKCVIWILFVLTLIIPINGRKDYEKQNFILQTLRPIQTISFQENVKEKTAEYENYIKKEDTTFEEFKKVRANLRKAYALSITFDVVLPIIWVLGIGVIFIYYLVKNMQFYHQMNQRKEFKDKRVQGILEIAKERLKIHKKKKIYLILQEEKKTPATCGVWNPKILIHESLLEKEDKEIEYIFMHELAHQKGKDLLINYGLILIEMLHWFNPFCKIFWKRIRQDIELKADEIVLTHLEKEERKQYGITLINQLAELMGEHYEVQVCHLIGIDNNTERRIFMIKMSNQFYTKTIRVAIISVVVILLILSIFLIGKVVKIEENSYEFDFSDLVSYQTLYIGDFDSVKRIARKLSLGNFIYSMETRPDNEVNCIRIKYGTYWIDKEKTKVYDTFIMMKKEEKEKILQKNALALLALVDNVDKVVFEVRDLNKDQDMILYEKEYDREQLQEKYGMDLRKYKEYPEQFPKEVTYIKECEKENVLEEKENLDKVEDKKEKEDSIVINTPIYIVGKCEVKSFKPTMKNAGGYTYDYFKDMNYMKKVYYKKINSYEEYQVYRNMWKDIYSMTQEDFKENFMIITAIENVSMLGLYVSNVEVKNKELIVELEKYKEGVTYNEEETCQSIKIPRTMETKNIVIRKVDYSN